MEKRVLINDKLQLEVISFLRFPLIVAVVLMHTKIRVVNGVEATDMHAIYPFGGLYPLYENTVNAFLSSSKLSALVH